MSQQINLFNPDFLQKKKLFTATTMAAGLGVLLLGLAAVGVAAKMRVASLQAQAAQGAVQLEKTQKRLAGVVAEFAPRKEDPRLAEELSQAQSELLALKEVAGVIERGELGNTEGYAEYFRALARQNVEGLWLTGVSIAGAGLDIGVRGRAMDAALVPGYLGRLRNERVMQGKPVGSLQIGEAAALRVVTDGKESSAPAPYVEFSLQSASQSNLQAKPGAQP
jgi:Tfp pilus assembly protein PilN